METIDEKDRGLFYPVILFRQLVLALGAIGFFFVVVMACYAELEEIGKQFFGDRYELLTLGFVIFLNAGGAGLIWLFRDFVEDVKGGKRLRNAYTLAKSTMIALSTYGLVNYQYDNMHGEGAHSFVRALFKLLL